MRWSLAGRSANTAATANHVAAQLWNPSSNRPVWVSAIALAQRAATVSNIALKRSTARGATPTTTVTPTIASDYEREISPPSAAVLELATFGTQPTLEGVPLFSWNDPAAVASGFIIPFETKDLQGIKILPGAGLCLYTIDAVIFQASDITFHMFE